MAPLMQWVPLLCTTMARQATAISSVPLASDYAQHELGGSDATYEQAHDYWLKAALVNVASAVVYSYLGIKFTCSRTYSTNMARAFVPKVIGNVVVLTIYGGHHAASLLQIRDAEDFRIFGSKESRWACQVTRLLPLALSLQLFGLVFILWAPYHLIVQGSKLCVARIRMRHVVAAVVASLAAGILQFLLIMLEGQFGDYRELWCGFNTYMSWSIGGSLALYSIVASVAGFSIVLLARRKFERVPGNASKQRLWREVHTLWYFGILLIGNFIIWRLPGLAVDCAEQILSWNAPMWLVTFSCVLVDIVPALDGVIVIAYVSNFSLGQHFRAERMNPSVTRTSNKSITHTTIDRGISMHYLHEFSLTRSIDGCMSIERVMKQHIKPFTRWQKKPFVDLVCRLVDEHERRVVGRAQVFVSHCWTDAFIRLVDALSEHYEENSVEKKNGNVYEQTMYFWIDIFAVNQHNLFGPEELPAIHVAIRESDYLLLILTPWHAPNTLSRVWCLYEIFQACQQNTPLEVTMPAAEKEAFLKVVRQDKSKIASMLDNVDAQKAQATVPRDRDTIFSQIQESSGFDVLNSTVRQKLAETMTVFTLSRSFTGTYSGSDVRDQPRRRLSAVHGIRSFVASLHRRSANSSGGHAP